MCSNKPSGEYLLVAKENMAPRPFPNSLKYNHLTDYSGTVHFLFSAVGADVKMTKMNRDKDLDIQLPFGVICFSYDGPEV